MPLLFYEYKKLGNIILLGACHVYNISLLKCILKTNVCLRLQNGIFKPQNHNLVTHSICYLSFYHSNYCNGESSICECNY